MKQPRKIDLRVQKTREAIKKAFKEMVCEMDLSNITVKALTERARIHRKTFYLHYTSIEALFEDILQDAANEYFKAIDQVPLPMPMTEVNRVFFTHLSRQEPFFERMICSPIHQDFIDKLFSINLKHNRDRFNPYAHLSKEEQNVVNTFLLTSSLAMYRQWLKDGKKLSLEEVINLSGDLLTSGISSVLAEE